MGKKGSWLSAIKRAFTPNSKDKPANVNDSEAKENKKTKTKTKTKKKKKLRHGDTNSFIPLFREPSSIEKIFGDFEREQQRQGLRPPEPEQPPPKASTASTPRKPHSPPRPTSPKPSTLRVTFPRTQTPKTSSSTAPRPTSPRPQTPKAPTPRVTSPKAQSSTATPTPRVVTSPRAKAPSSVTPRAQPLRPRAEPSVRNQDASATRIQAVYKGYMGRKRLRAVKGLVRLQGVVRGQSVKRQTANAMKYMQLVVRVQSQIQSRRIQMLDSAAPPHPSAEQAGNGNWDDSLLTKEEVDERTQKKVEAIVKRERAMAYAYSHQLWRASPKAADERVQRGFPWWYNWLDRHIPQRQNETMDIPTPRSSKSTMAFPSRMTPLRTPVASSQRSPFEFPARDNDSLTSCPAFSRPNFMTPTASAKAKSRARGSPRMPATPTDSNRRLSFPFVNRRGPPSSSSFLSPNVKSRPKSLISVGNASVDSTLSMPAAMGRKPFNRFV